MTPFLRWPVAIGASAAVHASVAVGLLAISDPNPVDQQPVPKAQIEMAAHAVRKSEATAAEPDSEAASEAEGESAQLGSEAVPVSDASPIAPETQSASEATPDAEEPVAASPETDRPSASEPDSEVAQTVVPDVDRTEAASPDAQIAQSAEPETVQPVAARPQTEPSIATTPQAEKPIVAEPQTQTVSSAVPNTTPALAPTDDTAQKLAETTSQAPKLEASIPETPALAEAARPAQPVQSANPSPQLVSASVAPTSAALPQADVVTTELKDVPQTAEVVQSTQAPSNQVSSAALPDTPALSAVIEAGAIASSSPKAQPVAEAVVVEAAITSFAPVAQQAPVPEIVAQPTPTVASDGPVLASFEPPSADAAPLDAPSAPAARAQPDSADVPSAVPSSQEAPGVAPDAAELAPSTPKTDALVARLAWTGQGDAEVSAVSLAAIQSFLQEGDVAAGEAVRDGIEGLLSQVPCSRIQAAFQPETGALELRGHIPEDGLRGPVLAALQAQMGADIPVTDNLLILERPQCGSLAGIAGVGLPQSTDQDRNPLLVGPSAHATVYDFRAGQRLNFGRSQAPDYESYIYLDYFDADGNVIHLAPNERVPLERFPPKVAIAFGPDSVSGRILDVQIGPPYGQEIAVAFASSVPIYDGVRPLIEPAAPYLEFLHDRVAKAREAHADFKGEWVYFFVATRP